MTRHKEIIDRNTKRPAIDVGVAGRLIRHALWDPNKPKDKDLSEPKSKKRKADEEARAAARFFRHGLWEANKRKDKHRLRPKSKKRKAEY